MTQTPNHDEEPTMSVTVVQTLLGTDMIWRDRYGNPCRRHFERAADAETFRAQIEGE